MAEQKKKRSIDDVEGGLPSPPNTTKQITITQPGTGQSLDTNQMETEQTETKTNDDDVVTFKAQLNGLKGVDPIPIPLDNSLKINEISTKMNEILKLINSNHGALRFKKSFFANSIPKSFELKVGNEDRIDFNENIFTISEGTRIIEYWNDFLDEAIIHDNEQKTEQIEGEIGYDGALKVKLRGTSLNIGDARIEFQRTLRIPDDNKTYPLPPSLGQFEICKTQDFIESDGLPKQWKKRKGVIIVKSLCLCSKHVQNANICTADVAKRSNVDVIQC